MKKASLETWLKLILPAVLCCCTLTLQAQITVAGKIVDASTGDPVTYATIAVRGTSIGTHSNFDGHFKLLLSKKTDTLTISCIGYQNYGLKLAAAAEQEYSVKMIPVSNALNEVRITPNGYINPAWAILKQVMLHKPQNDPRKLISYQYESYSRIELDASHLSSKLLKKKHIDHVLGLADSLKLTDPDHMPVLPLFLSETVSDFYYRSQPEARHETIKKTQTNGIGFEDGTLLSQLTGSTFQQYNFYQNFISAAGKDFVSPITDSWKNWYDYELENRDALVDGIACYQISFKPKRPQDLAFTGTVWIARDNYALYQIKATVEPAANLNFINRIAIQQQMDAAHALPWLVKKNRVLVEVSQLTSNSSGLLAKLYNVNKNIILNKAYDRDFFKERISVDKDAQQNDNYYWDSRRPDSLTVGERSVYSLIDMVRDIPVIRNYLVTADLLINGYYRAGDLSFGPFLNTYSYNDVEGNRLRLGFKTNSSFDKKWILGGYLAYGSKDQDVKYGANVDYILSRKNWTEAGISFSHDLNQVALLSDNYLYQRNNLFAAFTRFGRITRRKVFDQDIFKAYIRRDLFSGFTQTVSYVNWLLDPQFPFQFNEPGSAGKSRQLVVSELAFESSWSPGMLPLLSETVNRPLTLKTDVTAPVFTFRYTVGLRNVLGGDAAYQKFSFNITQTLKTGGLGRGKYSLSMGYIPSAVPFPLLENHLGNQTLIYNPNAFNLMRFFEFASDKYASLSYTQHFEGLLFNSIPLIKNFKWRLVGTANILYGGLSPANRLTIGSSSTPGVNGLGTLPYVEAGYGVENIFKFLRVDFIHRLTYRDNYSTVNGAQKNFGIKISAQLRL